jgi:hypothetical protein
MSVESGARFCNAFGENIVIVFGEADPPMIRQSTCFTIQLGADEARSQLLKLS